MRLDKGILHVRYKRCATCIFSTRSPISPDALEQRITRIEACGGYQECHHYTRRHRTRRGDPGVCCRGFFDAHHTLAIVLARALGVIRFVDDDGQEVAGE